MDEAMLNDCGKNLFRPWASVQNLLLVLAAIYVLVLAVRVFGLNSSEVASWVQAAGSILALVVALIIASSQGRQAAKDAKKKQFESGFQMLFDRLDQFCERYVRPRSETEARKFKQIVDRHSEIGYKCGGSAGKIKLKDFESEMNSIFKDDTVRRFLDNSRRVIKYIIDAEADSDVSLERRRFYMNILWGSLDLNERVLILNYAFVRWESLKNRMKNYPLSNNIQKEEFMNGDVFEFFLRAPGN